MQNRDISMVRPNNNQGDNNYYRTGRRLGLVTWVC